VLETTHVEQVDDIQGLILDDDSI